MKRRMGHRLVATLGVSTFLGISTIAGVTWARQQPPTNQPRPSQPLPLQQAKLNQPPAPEGNGNLAPTDQDGEQTDIVLIVPPDDAPTSVWMKKKLVYSQEMLRLLAIGDMAKLQQVSQRMSLVSVFEGFARSDSRTYTNHLRTFQLANRELTRQAAHDNIEGATLAFHQMTTSCVHCHVGIRKTASEGTTNASTDDEP
jgi:hypothetical protein